MKIHPLCQCVPDMHPDEYGELVADMKASGFDPRFPIVIYKGSILDGRHRWKAAQEAGVKATTIIYDGPDPAAFVLRAIRRRNLTAAQRAALAAELLPALKEEAAARMEKGKADPGTRLVPGSRAPRSTSSAGKAVGVGRQAVEVAAKAKEESPMTFAAMKAGAVSVAEAKKAIMAPPPRGVGSIEDAAGKTVQDQGVAAMLAEAPRFKELANEAHALKRRIKELAETKAGAEIRIKEVVTSLENVASILRLSAPAYQCPNFPNCKRGDKLCKGTGVVSELVWRTIPESDK